MRFPNFYWDNASAKRLSSHLVSHKFNFSLKPIIQNYWEKICLSISCLVKWTLSYVTHFQNLICYIQGTVTLFITISPSTTKERNFSLPNVIYFSGLWTANITIVLKIILFTYGNICKSVLLLKNRSIYRYNLMESM